jgi:competence protein ComEC
LRLPLLVLFGFTYAMWRGGDALALRIEPAYEGRAIELTGTVRGFPVVQGDLVRFELAPEESTLLDAGPISIDGRLRLGWYRAEWTPEPGQRLHATAVLKRPHGAANPGGFDFERFALQNRLAGTGYLRAAPERLPGPDGGLEHWRWRYAQALVHDSPDPAAAGLLAALAVGDQGAIPDENWDALRATGTAHLVSISGFHITVVAGLGALLARLLFRLWPGFGLRLARPRLAAALALAAALGYATLAGWSVPCSALSP